MISLTYKSIKSSKSRPVDDVATSGIVGLKETEAVDSSFPCFITFHNVAIVRDIDSKFPAGMENNINLWSATSIMTNIEGRMNHCICESLFWFNVGV